MPKVSKYVENKSNVLFDMYRQLADIKGGKAYKNGDTAVVRRRPRGGGRGGLVGVGGLRSWLVVEASLSSTTLLHSLQAPLTAPLQLLSLHSSVPHSSCVLHSSVLHSSSLHSSAEAWVRDQSVLCTALSTSPT